MKKTQPEAITPTNGHPHEVWVVPNRCIASDIYTLNTKDVKYRCACALCCVTTAERAEETERELKTHLEFLRDMIEVLRAPKPSKPDSTIR